MSQQISQACSKHIGKSYKELNCWDLVQSLYTELYDLDVHQYYGSDVPGHRECESLIRTSKGKFVKFDKPEPGDIILIKVHGIECHIGMFIGRGRFIHSLKDAGVVIDNISRYSTRITGYYRHGSLS